MVHISEENRKKAAELVAQMSLEEKVRLHSGQGAWHTEPVERLGLGNICLTDGPHGLRKKLDETKPLSQENTVKATCFPTAAANSCSFDRQLIFEMGAAMADECIEEEVGIILGPAANIKRSPLCGRNFEYISEDPFVAGEVATALINGIQSKNVGASLKHFLANNQETARLSSSSVIDERTMREIYLPAFENAVKNAQPFTVMCSYNRINGTFASNHKRMLTDILRDEWGFEGLVMTDWGAMDDRAESVRSGLDLEMPSHNKDFDMDIIEAIENGELDETLLDKCVERLVAVVLQTIDNEKKNYDRNKHNSLARRIARESAVLLRNENKTLPLKKTAKVAVIGEFAKAPRYQGAGSSLIAPHKITSVIDALKENDIRFAYARGYDVSTDRTVPELLDEAVRTASANDVDAIIAIVGLPDIYESEGYDRRHMMMPESHNRLIDELSALGKPVITVVLTGSAVEIPWRDRVDSILLMNLSGQNVGGAMYDLVFGDYSPCGKLTETYPLTLSDNPSYKNFGGLKNIEYRESIFVGYRYYDTARREVAYPFGFGLSYSSFEYENIKLSADSIKDTDTLKVSMTVRNIGNIKAKEIVQLYVKAPECNIFRALHELRGYEKVELDPGETKEVEFTLSKRAFAYYNVNISDWHVVTGTYTIEIAASSRDIRLSADVYVESEGDVAVPDYRSIAPAYYDLPETGELDIPYEQFEKLFDDKTALIPRKIKPFDRNSTLLDLREDKHGRKLAEKIEEDAKARIGRDTLDEDSYTAPMRSIMFPAKGMTRRKLQGMILYANGHTIKGKKLMEDK